MFFGFFIVAGIIVGYLAGGRLSNFQYVRIHLIWLIFTAVVLRLILKYLGFVQAGVLVGDIIILVFLIANLRENRAFLLAGIGFFANVIVIVLNKFAMPVGYRIQQLPIYAKTYQMLLNGEIPGYVLANESTKCYFLADIFYFPLYPKVGFFSIGDIILGIGGMLCIILFMKKEPIKATSINTQTKV
ncbi:MAG: DUF5317 domain-containing protein [Eubacteriaceae bacterium]|nr:DUF5317 domain-containing protein [Eubacteriaceae bacterium]